MIVGFQEIDSSDGTGIEELKLILANAAAELPQMGSLLNRRWKAARDELLTIQEPRISFEEFLADTYKEPWEGGVYIISGDTPIENVKQLEELYEDIFGSGELMYVAGGIKLSSAEV